MALSFQMAGSVGLLSYLSLKISIFSLLSVFSFFSMASLMKFESVLMTLLMSVLSLLSVMCYFSIKNIQNVQKFNQRAEIHLNTAASKLTYIERRMDASEGRMSDVVRHLAQAFEDFRLTIGPESWLENKVSGQFETFVGSQFKKFGTFEMQSWRMICSAAQAVSHFSLYAQRLEAMMKIEEIKKMEKNQTNDAGVKEWQMTLQEINISFDNWQKKIKWFQPFSHEELESVRRAAELSVSCQLADEFNLKADKDMEWLELETTKAKLSWETVIMKKYADEFSSSKVEVFVP